MSHRVFFTANVVFSLTLMAVPATFAQSPEIMRPTSSATSLPVSQLPQALQRADNVEHIHHPLLVRPSQAGPKADPVVQTSFGPRIDSTAGPYFDGIGADGYAPPDANIAVGPNYIVEVINLQIAVYDKNGVLAADYPKSLGSLWSPLGGACASNTGSDPVVQYDRSADVWLITQLGSTSSPFSECIAVSKTGDPTGAYSLYSYSFGTTLNDYPKFGIWPTSSNSAYLASYNLFTTSDGTLSFSAGQLCAYDRAAMIIGASSPVAICYSLANDGGYLPSDLDGSTLPLDGTPGYFLNLETLSSLRLAKLSPNFAVPQNSTLSVSSTPSTTNPNPDLTVAPFSLACGTACVPEAGGYGSALDSMGDRLMYRLAFRMFPDHEAMVVNHSVNTPSGVVGIRWYEFRSPVSNAASWSVFQSGTYAPDSTYRWMGSAAMDQLGDIAIGYSASSSSIHPAIRWAGRTPNLAPGTLSAEASIIEGLTSQINLSHWGDYSALRIDPSDDCTFWYANEYLLNGSFFGDGYYNYYKWSTHIGSFKFPACGVTTTQPADFSLSASPSSLALQQGQTGTSAVTVNSINNFSGPVNLALSGCPSSANCALNSSQVAAPGSAMLTVSSIATVAGSYPLTITGTSGGVVHTVTVYLIVPAPDFLISASPNSLSVQQGQTGTSTLTVTSVNGFNSAVNLTVSGCPTGATCSLPASITPSNGSATATFSVTPGSLTPSGTYSLTITGKDSSGDVHTVTVSLTVPQPDFGITLSSPTLAVARGSSNSLNVSLTGSSGLVITLSASGLPSNTSATFKPNPVTIGTSPTSSLLTITAARSGVKGTYTVIVTGKGSNNTSHSAQFSLTIN